MPSPSAPISCGIAGWSYPDWAGYVFPRGTRDTLRYIAPYMDCIEINTTFYRPPDPRTVQAWERRTRDLPRFFFTAKLHQDVTHRGEVDPAAAAGFHMAMAPLSESGRLRHLLAQFRYDFDDTPARRDHLARIRDAYGAPATLTLELRHRSWQEPASLAFLRGLGVSVANLDYPTARDSFDMPVSGVGDHAYLRLHGRNAAAWFHKGAGRNDTYNYLYDRTELEGIARRAMQIASLSKTVTLIANNHYRGKEAANALELKALLAGERVDVPPLLLHHYPQLQAAAKPAIKPDLFA